jgi:tetratricopeptide (TPR) repeat protein
MPQAGVARRAVAASLIYIESIMNRCDAFLRFRVPLALVMLACGQCAAAANVDAHAEVAAVLYAASATQAALAKSADARLRSQQDRIDVLAAELKTGDARHRSEMIAAQESFVAELAARDREYAAQIALFRNAVSDIAGTPEGAAALERFNAGDEIGALAILDKLRAANERMREARAKLEDAAEGRRIARLALEARTRGKLTTQAVILRYQDVVRLDAGVVEDWRELIGLYQDAGRLDDARKAVDALAAAAKDDTDRALASSELSAVLLLTGDLAGSRRAAEQSVTLARRQVAAAPGDAELEFQLSQTLISFGEIARRQGDITAAQKAYAEDIGAARRRAAQAPRDTRTRSFLAVDLLHLADVLMAKGDNAGARAALEETVKIMRELSAESPDNVTLQRKIGVTLMWLSDVLVSQGAFADARSANAEIVAIAARLSAADPAHAIIRRDLAYGYSKTANLQRIEGDFDAALGSYEHALEIYRELARSPTAALDMKQDVGTGLTDMADVMYLKDDFDGSRRANEESIALLRGLVSADATDALSRQFLAAALYGEGAALAAQAQYPAARKAYEEGLKIDRAMAAKDANAATIQFQISVGELGLGKVLVAQGDRNGLTSLQHALDARRRLATSQPGSSSAERGVAEVLRAMVDTPRSPVGWREFGTQVERMQSQGIFWPADRAWIDEARRVASSGSAP